MTSRSASLQSVTVMEISAEKMSNNPTDRITAALASASAVSVDVSTIANIPHLTSLSTSLHQVAVKSVPLLWC